MNNNVRSVYKKVFSCMKRCPRWVKVIVSILFIIVAIRLALLLLPYPTLDSFMQRQNSTRFYDRNNVLLSVMPLEEGLRREYYPLDEIPMALQKDFIEAEDKNFYHHLGVDFISIARAVIQNKKAGRVVSGASTITMQLVRLVYPRGKNSVTLRVKFVEMLHAFHIEAKLSKKKILELYLNNVPFGYQIEGVGSASRSFYRVEPAALSEEQMKTLAQIPRRPAEYAPEKTYTYTQLCPHFVNYVIAQYQQNKEQLPDKLTLSVDSELCEQAEKDIQQKIDDYKEARIHNGSALVINNRTGEILVWVGNGDFYDERGGQIDGVLVRNQPGSSMKPFLYALALEKNKSISNTHFEPTAIIPDIPQDFGSSKVYVPLNFNNRYNGPVRMRVALASSLNIPAVYVLYHVGVTNYMKQLSKLGFASLEGERGSTGLSLALGSGEVTLYEMVRAFSVFPRDGTLPVLRFTKVSATGTKALSTSAKATATGTKATKKIPSSDTKGMRVYTSDTTRIICDMLSDKAARSLGFGHAKVFETPYPCIFKTGTSNQFQNIIAMGATSECTAGVWLGNFEGETVIRQTGSSIPATIVRDLLDTLTKQYGASSFEQPETYAKQDVCVLSGMKPSKDCPSVTQEFVAVDDKSLETDNALQTHDSVNKTCTWHYRENGRVQIRYPSEYQHWSAGKNMAGSFSSNGTDLDFLYPTDGAVFVFDPTVPRNVQSLRVEAVGGSLQQAELFVDNKSAGRVTGRFFWNIPLEQGTHMLSVVCGGEERTIYFSVE